MVNSCSPDCIPEDEDFPVSDLSCYQMDTASYKSLKAKTEAALCNDTSKEQLFTSLANILRDSETCINQSLSVITLLLSETITHVSKLEEYLSDAVILLQMLTNYIKNTIGSELIPCCVVKTFPTSVGMIIITVFSHCKDSESLYGSYLSSVENQLKDLFRNCHELQITYHTVLEKHFSFDLTNKEEKSILLEVLDLNLRIGETVQALDVKSMASQLKALTILYEKYCTILLGTDVYDKCMSVLCTLIKTNINTSVEVNQDEKVVTRSLKVANFLLKMLLKTCDIFRQETRKEYTDVISLLYYIHETSANLHTPARSQFVNLIEDPSENLLKNLLSDEIFCNIILNSEISKIKEDGSFLGHVTTVTRVMDCVTQGCKSKYVTKSKLIECLYTILSLCNTKDIDVILYSSNESNKSNGLFEHLLIHSLALALSLNREEYNILESRMIAAILSTDHISALFSSNVWALLHMAKDINPQLLFNQIVWLCTMYKRLEKHPTFSGSPQKLHLTHTITKLFSLMENDDKMKICKQFRIHDDDNWGLWSALGAAHLPPGAGAAAEAVVADKLNVCLQRLDGAMEPEDFDKLTKVLSTASTCTTNFEAHVMRAWAKTCCEGGAGAGVRAASRRAAPWLARYLRAVLALTDSTWHHLCRNNDNLIKILHYVTSSVQHGGVEFKLLFINILCKLSTTDICESQFDNFTLAFTRLYNTSDIVRHKLVTTLKQYTHKNVDRILSNADLSLCDNLDEKCCKNVKYVHKCNKVESQLNFEKTGSGNFDFEKNIDTLFENDSDFEESACKKPKTSCSEAETIIKRLEAETACLLAMKGNVLTAECKSRIQNVCDDLYSVIR